MDDAGVLRSFAHDGTAAQAVLACAPLLTLPAGEAHRLSVVAGLGRAMAGEPGSDGRRWLAAEVVASVLRRVARAGRVHTRLRVEREAGPGDDEVTLRWPQADDGAARALADEAAGVVALVDDGLDEGTFLRACREAGQRLRG